MLNKPSKIEIVVDILRMIFDVNDTKYMIVTHSADGGDIAQAVIDPDAALTLSRNYRLCDEHGDDLYMPHMNPRKLDSPSTYDFPHLQSVFELHVEALEKLSRSMKTLRNSINRDPQHWADIAERLDTKPGRDHNKIRRESVEEFDKELDLKMARVLFKDLYDHVEAELYAIVQAEAHMFQAPKMKPEPAAKCVLRNAERNAKMLGKPVRSLIGRTLDRWQKDQDLRYCEREEIEGHVMQLLRETNEMDTEDLVITFYETEQDWPNETTRYWFEVSWTDYRTPDEQMESMFCIADQNGDYTLLDSDGCPIDECNYKTLPKRHGDRGDNLYDMLCELVNKRIERDAIR